MREICTSGSMSGDGKRSHGRTEAPPARESGWEQLLPGPTATAPILDSTDAEGGSEGMIRPEAVGLPRTA